MTSSGPKGRLESPCLSNNVCVDTNTVCKSGICLCADKYFEKDSLCSKFSSLSSFYASNNIVRAYVCVSVRACVCVSVRACVCVRASVRARACNKQSCV